MQNLSQEELLIVREILINLDKRYPEVLYDGILPDMDLADQPFSVLAGFHRLSFIQIDWSGGCMPRRLCLGGD